jgi:hypothetical protein
MWHAFSVLFRMGASLGLRHRRNPRLVCGTLSACNFVVCSRNLANDAKRASSGRVEAASSRFRARIARLPLLTSSHVCFQRVPLSIGDRLPFLPPPRVSRISLSGSAPCGSRSGRLLLLPPLLMWRHAYFVPKGAGKKQSRLSVYKIRAPDRIRTFPVRVAVKNYLRWVL